MGGARPLRIVPGAIRRAGTETVAADPVALGASSTPKSLGRAGPLVDCSEAQMQERGHFPAPWRASHAGASAGVKPVFKRQQQPSFEWQQDSTGPPGALESQAARPTSCAATHNQSSVQAAKRRRKI